MGELSDLRAEQEKHLVWSDVVSQVLDAIREDGNVGEFLRRAENNNGVEWAPVVPPDTSPVTNHDFVLHTADQPMVGLDFLEAHTIHVMQTADIPGFEPWTSLAPGIRPIVRFIVPEDHTGPVTIDFSSFNVPIEQTNPGVVSLNPGAVYEAEFASHDWGETNILIRLDHLAQGETVVVPDAPTNTNPPSISSADLNVGTVATAEGDTWTSSESYSKSYQWYRDDIAISGATGKERAFTEADAGHMITVEALASNSGGTTGAMSAAVGPITTGTPTDIVFVGAGLPESGTHADSVQPPLPGGIQANDQLIMIVQSRLLGTTPPGLSVGGGWTLVAHVARDSNHTWSFRRTATGSDQPTITTDSTDTRSINAYVEAWRYVDVSDPIVQVDADYENATSTFQPPDVVTQSADSVLTNHVATSDDNVLDLSTANGFIEQLSGPDYSVDHEFLSRRGAFGMAWRKVATPATTAFGTWSQTQLGSDTWGYHNIELRRAPTGGGTPPGEGENFDWPELTKKPPSFNPTRTVNVSSISGLQNAINNVVVGDDIVIAGGTYTGKLTITNKNLSNYARIRPADGANVIINDTGSGLRATLFMGLSSNWIIGHDTGTLTISANEYAWFSIALGYISPTKEKDSTSGRGRCHHIYVYNVNLTKGRACMRIGYDSYDIDVANCKMYDNGYGDINYAEGAYLGSASGTTDATHDIRFWYTEMYDLHAEGIDIKKNVYNVLVEGCWMHDFDFAAPSTSTRGGIAVRTTSGGININKFRCYKMRRASGVSSSLNEPCGIYVAGPCNIRDSMLFNNMAAGIRLNLPSSSHVVNVIQTTFFNNDTDNVLSNNDISRASSTGTCNVRGCLYESGQIASANIQNSGTVTSSDFDGPLTGSAMTTYAGDGLRLASDSAHRNSITPYTTADLRGVPRSTPGDKGALQRV